MQLIGAQFQKVWYVWHVLLLRLVGKRFPSVAVGLSALATTINCSFKLWLVVDMSTKAGVTTSLHQFYRIIGRHKPGLRVTWEKSLKSMFADNLINVPRVFEVIGFAIFSHFFAFSFEVACRWVWFARTVLISVINYAKSIAFRPDVARAVCNLEKSTILVVLLPWLCSATK